MTCRMGRWMMGVVLCVLVSFALVPGCFVSEPNLECRPCLADGGCVLPTFQCIDGMCHAVGQTEWRVCEIVPESVSE